MTVVPAGVNWPTATLRLGARRILVTRPNERQYGHLGLEYVMSLARARNQGVDVCFVHSSALGSGLRELESPAVRVLRPAPVVREMLRGCLSWQRFHTRVVEWREHLEREFVRETSRYIDSERMPDEIREGLRGVRRRLRSALEDAERERRRETIYFERRLLREPVPVRLHPAAAREAERQARARGIAPDAPLVCIHAREPGYKLGREMHDTKPHEGRDDRARNARIESYLAAVDALAARGFTVVRLGDPSMTPLPHPGVVDLATAPSRTNLLEIYCLLRSRMLIAGESGLAGITYVTNTPFLLVNATEPIAAYPVRAPGLFLTKAVFDRRDGRPLTNLDLLTFDYHRQFRDTRRFAYADNTPEQIRDAALEMLEWLSGTWRESAGQRAYHDAIVSATAQLHRRSRYVRKWGLHEGFLGDGRIARAALGTQ